MDSPNVHVAAEKHTPSNTFTDSLLTGSARTAIETKQGKSAHDRDIIGLIAPPLPAVIIPSRSEKSPTAAANGGSKMIPAIIQGIYVRVGRVNGRKEKTNCTVAFIIKAAAVSVAV